MALPKLNISFQNGALKSVVSSPDGVFGMIISAEAVASTFALKTPYLLRSTDDVAALGIVDDEANHLAYKTLNEFYSEAGEGAELWIMGVAKTLSMDEIFSTTEGGKKLPEVLLDAANGRLRGLFVAYATDEELEEPEEGEETGLAEMVYTALPLAQILAVNYTNNKYAPIFVVLDGFGYDGNPIHLEDLTEMTSNRVGILIGDTAEDSTNSAIGLLAGRLAKIQVHVKTGRVKDGPVNSRTMFIKDKAVENANVASIHDKGYMTFRSHVGRAGYFFSDDPLAALTSDDYRFMARRRVIDKAYRIAYDTLLNFLLDDVSVNSDGTVSTIYAKVIENLVISAIYSQMTANGELSADLTDSKDFGVICKVDLNHNVVSTSTLKIEALQVRTKGYSSFIEVPIGFVPVTNN